MPNHLIMTTGRACSVTGNHTQDPLVHVHCTFFFFFFYIEPQPFRHGSERCTCTCHVHVQDMYIMVHTCNSGLYAIPQRNITPFLDDSRGVQFQKTGPAMAGPAGPPATALSSLHSSLLLHLRNAVFDFLHNYLSKVLQRHLTWRSDEISKEHKEISLLRRKGVYLSCN